MRVTSHRSRSCSDSIRGRRLTRSKHIFEVPDRPKQAYIAPLPHSCEKFKDQLKLKKFVSEQNKSFYDQLPVDNLTCPGIRIRANL